MYSTNADFSSYKSLYVSSSYSAKTVGNLSEGQKYFVKIRCYKTIDGTKYFSSYSATKYVTTKTTALPMPEPDPIPDDEDCTSVCFSDDMEIIENGGALNNAYYQIDRPVPRGVIKGISFSSQYTSTQMQYFYICEQTDNGLKVLKTIEFSGVNKGLNYVDVQYETEKETYIVTKSWMSYTSAGNTSQMLYSVTMDGDEFVNKSGVANFQVKMTVFVKEPEKEDIPDNQIVVAKDGTGSFTTINAALKQAYSIESRENPITIVIKSGVYKEVLFIGAKHNVSLVGTDRDTCIIRDDSGNYNNAPVRIEGNSYIANLTIIATHNDDPTYETRERDSTVWMDTVGSYAIHIDDVHNDDDLDYLCRVENCKLYSEQMAVVGCGLHKNQTVELVNCEIVKNLSQTLYDNPVYTKHGAVFCHTLSMNTKDYTDFGYQHFSMIGCCVTTNIDRTLELGTVGTQADVTFVNNTFTSGALELEKSVTMHSDFILTKESTGNNVTKLNN
ncbi:MAG: pectinesterase family protein [Eubacterium sp.]